MIGSSGPQHQLSQQDAGQPAPPHHLAEVSLDDSGRQAVHPYVTLGQFYGQVLAEAQQGCFTDIVRAQALGKGKMG